MVTRKDCKYKSNWEEVVSINIDTASTIVTAGDSAGWTPRAAGTSALTGCAHYPSG